MLRGLPRAVQSLLSTSNLTNSIGHGIQVHVPPGQECRRQEGTADAFV